MGPIFVFSLLAFVCLGGLARPHIGVIGYYGFALLQPEWNWRWSVPQDLQYQKFIAASTLLGFLINGMPGNRFQGPVAQASGWLVGFLALAGISMSGSIAPPASAFYMDIMWKIVLMALLAIRLIDTPGKALALLWVLVLAQGYNAYQINLQYFQDGFSMWAVRGFGGQGDNNIYSNLTIPLIACSLSLALYSQRLWQKLLAAGIALMQAHQIMLLESRGAMLAGIVMAAVFLWGMPKTRQTWTAVLVLGVVGGALAGPPVVEEFSSSFKEEGERDSSAEGRFDLWAAGWAITKDYPLLGVGPYAGQYLVPRYYPGGLDQGAKGLHNLAFEISTGCGIPALIAYLGFFAVASIGPYRILRRKSGADIASCLSLAVFCGLVGYWVASMFSSGALVEASYACAVLGVVAPSLLQQELDSSDEDSAADREIIE